MQLVSGRVIFLSYTTATYLREPEFLEQIEQFLLRYYRILIFIVN
jgi:hypothetical protein